MKITIARALKERARLTGKIAKTFKLIEDENSVNEGAARSVDIRAKYEEYLALSQKLAILKSVISKANTGIIDKLTMLSETKAMLSQIRSIPCKDGKQLGYTRGEATEYVMNAVLKKADLTAEQERLQEQANILQDEIDEFNGSTFIEVEL